MRVEADTREVLTFGLNAALLVFAVWLLSPYFVIEASDYAHARANVYRLVVGLTLLILYLGKFSFDTLAPQGLARRVSGLKGVAVILFGLVLLGFIIFTIVQAGTMFLQAGAQIETPEF